jgi:hypothetical protein
MGLFVAIPIAFVDDERITNAGRCLYTLLSSYTSAKADEAIAFPSYETIMKRLGWGSKETVAAALLNLMQHGWIERKRRYSNSSVYTINYAPGEYRPEIELSPVVRKSNLRQSGKRTTDSPESRHQPEVPRKQEVPKQEVGGAPPTVAVKGFGKVYIAHPDARVAAYLDIMGQPHITASNAQIILDRTAPEHLDTWRAVLTLWASSAWNPRNITGMIERYEGDKNAKRFPKPAAAQPIGQWTPAKGMYPQVPDKPQPPPAPRKATMFGIEVDTVDHSKTTEVPF